MRFIIHEMAYEKPITAGQWQYQANGQPTGAVESWRLTEAVDGYRFLRVDLDAREASSGRSMLYHLTLDENGNALQLKFRLFAKGQEIVGNVLLEEDAAIFTRETVKERFEDVMAMPPGFAFWFPATAGLSLLASRAGLKESPALTLNLPAARAAKQVSLLATALSVDDEGAAEVASMGQANLSRRLVMRWENQERRLWVDENGWPLRMERDDGLTAVLTRQINYQQITKPGAKQKAAAAESRSGAGQKH